MANSPRSASASAHPAPTTKAFDYLAFIGRFQPFHLGHAHVVRSALERAAHVVVLIGSPNIARSVKNPFTFEERVEMIRATFPADVASGRLILRAVDDYAYNETAWVTAVQRKIKKVVSGEWSVASGRQPAVPAASTPLATSPLTTDHSPLTHPKIGIVGLLKDASSYYLKLFPEWEFVDIEQSFGVFHATDIRADYFRRATRLPRDLCPEPVVEALDRFRMTQEYARLVAEADWVDAYKKSWAAAPYAPTFVTVDCVVQQAGHVLLVERGDHPGKGLLALPGGFVDANEHLRESAIRELREETAIADQKGPLPPAMLASFIEDSATRVFDAPGRSVRGRTITHAFLFRCPDRAQLFKIKGSDDAAHASWHRLGDLNPRDFFEDHWFILQAMTGI